MLSAYLPGPAPNTAVPATSRTVWIDIVMVYVYPAGRTLTTTTSVAQLQLYTPNVANGSVVGFQIRGPALLYANPIRISRIGTYSDTTGWPAISKG
jgi:hypothetical protein